MAVPDTPTPPIRSTVRQEVVTVSVGEEVEFKFIIAEKKCHCLIVLVTPEALYHTVPQSLI